MPRQARIDAPGALHHVIIRGIERKAIFKDAKDYRNFLDRLGLILTETETPCLIENYQNLLKIDRIRIKFQYFTNVPHLKSVGKPLGDIAGV